MEPLTNITTELLDRINANLPQMIADHDALSRRLIDLAAEIREYQSVAEQIGRINARAGQPAPEPAAIEPGPVVDLTDGDVVDADVLEG